jgi:acyl-coenzyme A synthetase/AMP-(fatty) acid ligase
VVELDGRVSEVLRTAADVVTTREFDDAIADVEALEFYVARSRAGGVRVQGIVAPGLEAQVERALRAAIAPLGFERVEVVFVETLPLGASGKLQLTGEDDRNALETR